MDDEMDFEGAISPPQQPQPTAVYPQAEPNVPARTIIHSDGDAKMLYVPFVHTRLSAFLHAASTETLSSFR
jgi:hypothetical protein